MRNSVSPPADDSASMQIDSIIKKQDDWRGKMLSQLRSLILKTDNVVFEEVKWKKPSKPEGVAVWSYEGIICVADILKNAVRLTFPKGAKLKDPKKLFNTRLQSNSVRAIDFFEGGKVNAQALQGLVKAAIKLNVKNSK